MSYLSSPCISSDSLSVKVAQAGVRGALAPFLRKPEACFVVVAVVPRPKQEWLYELAVRDILLVEADGAGENSRECFIVTSAAEIFPETAYSIADKFRKARRSVILCGTDEEITPALRLLADRVVSIPPPTAAHYLIAARSMGLRGMTKDAAEFLSSQELEDVHLALRPGQPLSLGLQRLKQKELDRAKTSSRSKQPGSEPRLETMAGYGEAKDWGLQLAADLAAWRRGEVDWEDLDRGALLHGPPGCGKTIYARALANSCGVQLVTASAARWQARGHLGDYLKAMRESFRMAAARKPAILFLDEFDSVGDREAHLDSRNADYKRQAINALLECLDPSEGREGVIVIGATNDANAVDRALLRPGRLERIIAIGPPGPADRVAILRHYLRDADDLGDFKEFAIATAGWSGADIEKLAREARRSSRRRGTAVTMQDVLDALPPRQFLKDTEILRAAGHEAGHALVGTILRLGQLDHVYVSDYIFPGKRRIPLGQAVFGDFSAVVATEDDFADRITMLLAGIAAEKTMFGDHSAGAGGDAESDLARATDLATMMERYHGYGSDLTVDLGSGSRPLERLRAQDPALRQAVEARLKAGHARAMSILNACRGALDLLTRALFERRVVLGHEVAEILTRGIEAAEAGSGAASRRGERRAKKTKCRARDGGG